MVFLDNVRVFDYCHSSTPTPNPACSHTGDVNFTGEITVEDAQLAYQIALGIYTSTPWEDCAADCNGNGSVTALDAQLIFSILFGENPCFDPLN